MTAEWSAEQREVFRSLGDILAPATERFPSSSEADPHARLLDRALRARPDLAERLAPLLTEAVREDPVHFLDRLRSTDPELLEDLITLVVGTYYMSPKVLHRLSYPGQQAAPPLPDEADFYLSDGLLEPVMVRGARYRPTPAHTEVGAEAHCE